MENNYIKEFYTMNCNEEERLLSRSGNVEYVTTMSYIHMYLKDNPQARILEVGAGTGRYSIELADEGYTVNALELVEENLAVLRSKIKPENRITAEQGNALDLSRYEDNTFDLTLVLGPMYHLFTDSDKKTALQEAIRVTKKNGIIMIAYCMNEATIIQYMFGEQHIAEYVKNERVTADFKGVSEPSEVFDLMRVEDIDRINWGMAIDREKLIATDGAAMYIKEMLDRLTDEEYNMFIDYHLRTCERQDLIGATNHALDILRKK